MAFLKVLARAYNARQLTPRRADLRTLFAPLKIVEASCRAKPAGLLSSAIIKERSHVPRVAIETQL